MLGDNLFAIVGVLFLVFLTMGAIVSVVQEAIGQVLKVRSSTLRGCVSGMLGDDAYGDTITQRFFRHPRIVTPGNRITHLTNINNEDFAIAFASAIQPEASDDDSVTNLGASIRNLREGRLKHRLRLALPEVFTAEPDPDRVKKAVSTWFDAQMNKVSERFRSHTRVRLYITAAIVTVLFNVSAIKIVQGLRDQPELAKAFNNAAPELARLVFDTSQNALSAMGPKANAPPEDGSVQNLFGEDPNKKIPITLSTGEVSKGFTVGDARAMLFFYDCRRNLMVLPVGWPWMSGLVDGLAVRAAAIADTAAGTQPDPNETLAERQANACAQRLSNTDFTPEAAQQLSLLGFDTIVPEESEATPEAPPAPDPQALLDVELAAPTDVQPEAPDTAPDDETQLQAEDAPSPAIKAPANTVRFAVRPSDFTPQFGPNFRTDPWYAILLGWLITTFAAAQGAPFWFDLLRKITSRPKA